jgi:hypothetical protein
MARWYREVSSRRHSSATGSDEKHSADGGGLVSALAAKVSSLFARQPDGADAVAEADVTEAPARRRAADRPARTARAAAERNGKPARRTPPSRSRHTRPPEADIIEPPVERPRRRRSHQAEPPPAEPRRRPRTSSTSRRSVPPPDRRNPYERPARPDRPQRRRSRFDDYEPLEPHGGNGFESGFDSGLGSGFGSGNGTHHPISRVRYRASEEGPESQDRAEYRTPPRRPRSHEADAWEYDI